MYKQSLIYRWENIISPLLIELYQDMWYKVEAKGFFVMRDKLNLFVK